MSNVICEWEVKSELGEGPLWVASENAVYWVDILLKKVHRLSLAGGAKKTWTFDVAVTSLVERQKGGFVCTIRDGYAFIDLDASKINPIALPEADLPSNRFNDGKLDAQGRYWAGTMHDAGQNAEDGGLYRLDADLGVKKMDSGYIIANGPTFNVDNTIIYHTDSAKRTIYAFDMDGDGEISNKRVFVKLKGEEGSPDGMTVDSEDCIWLAHFGGARLTRYSPKGEILQVVPIPAKNVTSCTFAGQNLDTLYITTAGCFGDEDCKKNYPLAGSLFSFKPDVKGLPTPLFPG